MAFAWSNLSKIDKNRWHDCHPTMKSSLRLWYLGRASVGATDRRGAEVPLGHLHVVVRPRQRPGEQRVQILPVGAPAPGERGDGGRTGERSAAGDGVAGRRDGGVVALSGEGEVVG